MHADKIQVLFVDDDHRLLNGLTRMLRTMRKEWNMEFAFGGPAGISEIQQKKFDVVVSDMRMPEIDGVQLLKEVRKRSPDSIRIILSGQAKEESVFKVLNYAHQYIAKPCDAERLKRRIQQACTNKNRLEQSHFSSILCDLTALGSSYNNYNTLIKKLSLEDPRLSTIADTISKDIPMTLKVLQLANSAFFGGDNKVLDLFAAVNILGVDTIRELSLRGQITKTQKTKDFSVDQIRRARLLNMQSVIVAKLAQAIACSEQLSEKEAHKAYTLGLLHNLGLHIIAYTDRRLLQQVFSYMNKNICWLPEAESAVLGVHSQQIANALLAIWGIPETVNRLTTHQVTTDNRDFDAISCAQAAYDVYYGYNKKSDYDDHSLKINNNQKHKQWIVLLADILAKQKLANHF